MYCKFVIDSEFFIKKLRCGINKIPIKIIVQPIKIYAFFKKHISDFILSIFLSAMGLYKLYTTAVPTPRSATDNNIIKLVNNPFIPK